MSSTENWLYLKRKKSPCSPLLLSISCSIKFCGSCAVGCYFLQATSAGKLILFLSHISRHLFACLLLRRQHIKANIWNKALGASHICCWMNKANVKKTQLIMLQGIKQLSFLAKGKKHSAPHCSLSFGEIPGKKYCCCLPKGWTQLGDQMRHWSDLANHILCSSCFLGMWNSSSHSL